MRVLPSPHLLCMQEPTWVLKVDHGCNHLFQRRLQGEKHRVRCARTSHPSCLGNKHPPNGDKLNYRCIWREDPPIGDSKPSYSKQHLSPHEKVTKDGETSNFLRGMRHQATKQKQQVLMMLAHLASQRKLLILQNHLHKKLS